MMSSIAPKGDALGAQVRGVSLERAEKLLHAAAERCLDHTQMVDNDCRARQLLVELLGRDHLVQLLALAFDEEEPTEIAAVRLQEDGLETLDILLRLLRAEVLNKLAEDLGRAVLASSRRGSEADKNAVVRHDTPPLTGRGYSPPQRTLGAPVSGGRSVRGCSHFVDAVTRT